MLVAYHLPMSVNFLGIPEADTAVPVGELASWRRAFLTRYHPGFPSFFALLLS